MSVEPISSPEAESIKKSMFSCGHTSMGQILLWIPSRSVIKGTVHMLYIAMQNTMHSTMRNTMHRIMHNHRRSAANKISPGLVIVMYNSCTPQKLTNVYI